MPRMVSLPKRFAELIPELAKFGVVGLVGSIVDLGGAAYLHGAVGIGPMVSKGLSIIAATVLTYLGSRFWTFRHRVNQGLLREGALFAVLNVVGLVIAECVIAFVTYGLDMKGTLVFNAASLVGTGLGTDTAPFHKSAPADISAPADKPSALVPAPQGTTGTKAPGSGAGLCASLEAPTGQPQENHHNDDEGWV